MTPEEVMDLYKEVFHDSSRRKVLRGHGREVL